MIGFKTGYDKNGNPCEIIKDGIHDIAILSENKQYVYVDCNGEFDIDDMRELCNCLNELKGEMIPWMGKESRKN